MKLFAAVSPFFTWLCFLLLELDQSPIVPDDIVDALFAIFGMVLFVAMMVTSIIGCCASYIYFRRDSSQLSKKVLYVTSFVHGLFFSGVYCCALLEVENMSHIRLLGDGLFTLCLLTVACWFTAVVVHVVWTYRPHPNPLPEGEGKNDHIT